MDRSTELRKLLDRDGFGLEIGPSYNPAAPKRDGWNVESLDYANQDRLRTIYNSPDIEVVDYVSEGRSVAQTVPHRSRYDWIVASHVIEHQPDIISFINDCGELLKPGGHLVLAVPDKRYCFDLFRPLSTAGQALQAYYERRTRHQPSMAFDHHAYAMFRSGHGTWPVSFDGQSTFVHDVEYACGKFASALDPSVYQDLHTWFFTPSSFRLMVKDLRKAAVLNLDEAELHLGFDHEFFVVMKADAEGCSMSRLELYGAIWEELRAVPR